MPLGLSQELFFRIEAKTAAYQIVDADNGKIFTTRGAAGSVTFTLPVVTTIATGWHCRFFQAADQNMVVASQGSSDNISTLNDLTADSITFSTASELIGNGLLMVWDGTGWLAFFNIHETATPTIA